jgi:hypothetical protein
MGPSPSTVDGTTSGAAVDSKSDVGASDVDTRSGGAPSSETRGTNAVMVPRNVADGAAGGLELVPIPFASPVLSEVALVACDGGPDELG